MPRTWGPVAGLVMLLLAVIPGAAAANHAGVHIDTLGVTAEVRADGTVAVTERFDVDWDQPGARAARAIPVTFPQVRRDGSRHAEDARVLTVSGWSATRDGEPEPVRAERFYLAGRNILLSIGDPGRVLTGRHDYELHYQIRGLPTAPDGRPELYWVPFGRDSTTPLTTIRVTVTAPGPLGRVRCGISDQEEVRPCSSARVDGATATFLGHDLGTDGEEMSVTVGLPDTVTVPAPVLPPEPAHVEPGISPVTTVLWVVGLAVLALLILGGVFLRTRDRYFAGMIPGLLPAPATKATQKRRMRARTEAPAVRFEPPDDVPAPLCGVLLDRRATGGAVAAVLTDLVLRGRLRITEVSKGVRIERLEGADEDLASYEREFLDAVPEPVTLPGDRVTRRRFRSVFRALARSLVDEAVDREWLVRAQRRSFRGCGCWLLAFSMGPLGWLLVYGGLWWLLWLPVALAVIMLWALPGRWRMHRTAAGTAMHDQVLDFRRYLETAEADQLADGERRAEVNRYLPYAQAFGIANHWSGKVATVGEIESV